MEPETKHEPGAGCTCPFCALWDVYQKSEAAKHAAVIYRESLLLARSLLDACIRKTEERLAAMRSKL